MNVFKTLLLSLTLMYCPTSFSAAPAPQLEMLPLLMNWDVHACTQEKHDVVQRKIADNIEKITRKSPMLQPMLQSLTQSTACSYKAQKLSELTIKLKNNADPEELQLLQEQIDEMEEQVEKKYSDYQESVSNLSADPKNQPQVTSIHVWLMKACFTKACLLQGIVNQQKKEIEQLKKEAAQAEGMPAVPGGAHA